MNILCPRCSGDFVEQHSVVKRHWLYGNNINLLRWQCLDCELAFYGYDQYEINKNQAIFLRDYYQHKTIGELLVHGCYYSKYNEDLIDEYYKKWIGINESS